MERAELKEVTPENIDAEHICCAIGNDPTNRARAEQKKEWLRCRFADGHRFIKADLRGKVFIEFEPADKAWAPIDADGYLSIQCLWASGRYKGQGYGRELMEAALDAAREQGARGLVAISSPKKKPFMVDGSFLAKAGFQVVDQAPPYFQLMSLELPGQTGTLPRFRDGVRSTTLDPQHWNTRGFQFFYSEGCPFNRDFTTMMADMALERGFEAQVFKVESRADALSLPSPWPLFSMFYNGEFVDHMVYPEKTWAKKLDELSRG